MRPREEHLVEQLVTYTLEHDGRFIIENVAARVDQETGEQNFAPETVEKLHEPILGGRKPDRTVETPVYDFSQRAA